MKRKAGPEGNVCVMFSPSMSHVRLSVGCTKRKLRKKEGTYLVCFQVDHDKTGNSASAKLQRVDLCTVPR